MASVDSTLNSILEVRGDVSEMLEEVRRLRSAGPGGTLPPVEERVTRLETHFEYVRRDLDEIKDLLKVLPSLATKRDLDTWRWQWLATGLAIIALTVGGITGGLALIAKFAS